MLESFTIFAMGGKVCYQYLANPSLMDKAAGAASPAFTTQALNQTLITKFLFDSSRAGSNKTFHIDEGTSFVWQVEEDLVAVALYPDILFEGPRQYLKQWATALVAQALQAYQLQVVAADATDATDATDGTYATSFDATFTALLHQSKNAKAGTGTSTTTATTTSTTTPEKSEKSKPATNKKGKADRHWGEAKVTEKAMAQLDRSKPGEGGGDADQQGNDRALQEARAAYLPTAEDLKVASSKQEASSSSAAPSWSDTATGWFQHVTGNKVLTAADLQGPLQQMETFLTGKNVAQEIAQQLTLGIQNKLVGKKLNSLYRVQTAVQQAAEGVVAKVLSHDVDLLRNVLSKRGDSIFSTTSKKRPYVICVVGINGVGKSTSLAKLAYYFKENGCKPLLVAGDTFRSGAVEQLRVHADCLKVPIFHQGYSKDPSVVGQAAIVHATEQGNDVVLIDTAGRMQNNVPLMKALGKLAAECKPDFCLLVAEALVGHDGLDQYRMFTQALGRRGIDGLVVTKFDTVSTKVGASLTLTHETGVPIVFCGTGQKYHHLTKLQAADVVRTLFS